MVKDTRARDRVLLHNGLLALVLGYPLSIALSGVAYRLMRQLGAGLVTEQLTMWIVYPLWLIALSLVFLIPTRRACWRWLLAANGVAAALYWLLSQAGAAP